MTERIKECTCQKIINRKFKGAGFSYGREEDTLLFYMNYECELHPKKETVEDGAI